MGVNGSRHMDSGSKTVHERSWLRGEFHEILHHTLIFNVGSYPLPSQFRLRLLPKSRLKNMPLKCI